MFCYCCLKTQYFSSKGPHIFILHWDLKVVWVVPAIIIVIAAAVVLCR